MATVDRQRTFLIAMVLTLTAVAANPAAAQRSGEPPEIQDSDLLPTRSDLRPSSFQLLGIGDFARTGVVASGSNDWCYGNTGFLEPRGVGCAGNHPAQFGTALAFASYPWFEVGFVIAAAPPTEYLKTGRDLDNVRGGGWTVNVNQFLLGGQQKVFATDRSGSELLQFGVVGTSGTGKCTDVTNFARGAPNPAGQLFFAGVQMLPVSVCQDTWPGGVWTGTKPIPPDAYGKLYASGDSRWRADDVDPFRFWSVPDSLREEGFLGTFHTFGEMSDFSRDAVPLYGSVTPHGSGAPTVSGWPLGITAWFDGFNVGIPTLANAWFMQMTLVNESRNVYGIPIDYDSLYVGLMPEPLLNVQNVSIYGLPDRGVYVFKQPGPGTIGRPVPPGSASDSRNWGLGGAGFVVLKSPIGDLRYKHFTDPNSQFFNPSHKFAGDTITFNHAHHCGFGDCWNNVTLGRSQRAGFGIWSSTKDNVLDGRSPGDLTDRQWHRTFRDPNWPSRTGFSSYVPVTSGAGWDYNHDGILDTLHLDTCHVRGCVPLGGGSATDTLPSGWVNSYGNISVLGIGPIHLKAGDTTAMVVAFFSERDSINTETVINNIIDFYMSFYLAPKAAPAPTVVAVDVRPGDIFTSEVRLFLNDTTENHVDPFLIKFRDDLLAAPAGTELGRLRNMNPTLADSILARAQDNVEAVYLFKSCDGGVTFTDDGDCFGDPVPAADQTSIFNVFGWLPFATLRPDAAGRFANLFVDNSVQPGITYTYSFVTRGRGATFLVIDSIGGSVAPRSLTIAPQLFSALSRSAADPQVARVYVPASLQGGAQAASVSLEHVAGTATVPLNVVFSSVQLQRGNYRIVLGDTVTVSAVDTLRGGNVIARDTFVFVGQKVRAFVPPSSAVATAVRGKTFRAFLDPTISGTFTTSSRTDTVFVTDTIAMTTDTLVAVTSTRRMSAFSMVLVNTATNEVMLVSSTLTGDAATPGTFLSRPDFPFFIVSANNAVARRFNAQLWRDLSLPPSGDTLNTRVFPSVTWLTAEADTLGSSARRKSQVFGDYALLWRDEAFGLESRFNRNDPNLQGTFTAELQGRVQASRSRADADAIAALLGDSVRIKASPSGLDPLAPFTVAEMQNVQEFSLPFAVRSVTRGTNVDVVVLRHQSSVLLDVGPDTVRVNVPAGAWVPGDELVLLETVLRDSTILIDGSPAVVLDTITGLPIQVPRLEATWQGSLGCLVPRRSCNPINVPPERQLTSPSSYAPVFANWQQHVVYHEPFSPLDDYRFATSPLVTGDSLLARREVKLDSILVVPNPYIVFSGYERSPTERVLKFTHMPPRGIVRIYTVTGQFVQQIKYGPSDLEGGDGTSGDLRWDMKTRENTELAYGLYVFVVTALDENSGVIGRKIGKFVVLR